MDLLTAVILLSAFVIVPGLLNYYSNRRAIPGGVEPGRWELLFASLALTWALLTIAAMVVLLIALVWEGLREELSEFINKGFRGYAFDRPFALSGVLTGVSLAAMALMTALGVAQVPGRWLKK